MLSCTVPLNSTVSWSTTATCSRSQASEHSRASRPSIVTRPSVGSKKRATSAPSVDFPTPDGPISASRSPGRTRSETPLSTGRSAP